MFTDLLIHNIKATKAPLVVGLDPNLSLIPNPFKANYDLSEGALAGDGYFETISRLFFDYNKYIIDQVMDLVPAIKPQMAYYEVLGHFGMKCLKDTIQYAQQKGLLVILDGKRNDIASTAQAYVEAYLVNKHHSPYISADSITVTPFLGMDSLEPFFKVCNEDGKGLFICLKTSNPGSGDLQDKVLSNGQPLYIDMAERIHGHTKGALGKEGYSGVGVVVGATYPGIAQQLRSILPHSFFLVPGIGFQGGDITQIKHFFNPDGFGAVLNASRSIMYPPAHSSVRQETITLIQTIGANLPNFGS